MFSSFIRKVLSLDLEEKILNSMLVASLLGLLCPWIGGKLSLIDDQTVHYSGFGFYTSFIGFAIFGLLLFSLLITLIPLLSGNQLVGKEKKDSIRLACITLATILILSSLSVLLNVTFTSPGMEVRFGIYVSLITTMIASLYAFLKLQDRKTKSVQDFFHQENSRQEEQEKLAYKEEHTAKDPLPTLQNKAPSAPEPELHGQLRR